MDFRSRWNIVLLRRPIIGYDHSQNELDPQGYFWDVPELFYEKTMSDKVILISFLAGPLVHKPLKSGVHFAVRWILIFLGLSFFFKWPIKISNGPSKS